jgi:hypothetical protein
MANNDFKEKHNIVENVIILSPSDFSPKPYFLRFLLSINLDYDLIMVNQLMFTFKRQTGYMVNNGTQENWSWKETDYMGILRHHQFDFGNNSFLWLLGVTMIKGMIFLNVVGAFALISIINGLVIRMALVCANVAIFPMMCMIRTMTGQRFNNFQLAQIYH